MRPGCDVPSIVGCAGSGTGPAALVGSFVSGRAGVEQIAAGQTQTLQQDWLQSLIDSETCLIFGSDPLLALHYATNSRHLPHLASVRWSLKLLSA